MLTEDELREARRIDIGCGRPDQKHEGCVGLDINPEYQPDVLHNADDGLPFTNDQLDFIHCDNALEHFRNPHFVLRECLRTLRPGGEALLVLPNCRYLPIVLLNLVCDINKAWHWYMNLPIKKGRSVHFTLYTRHLAMQVVEDVGFQIVSAKGWPYSKEITLRLRKPPAGEEPTRLAGPRAG